MPSIGERVCDVALGLVGIPFRLHGRSTETGVDCVGLALLSLRGAGLTVPDPPPYRLRTRVVPVAEDWFGTAGFVPGAGRAVGDLVLVRVGPLQLHLLVETGDGVVHAHAGLRRVVHGPRPGDWPEIARWRWPG